MERQGRVPQQSVPDWLDWDMYCGPAPLRPYHGHRFGGTHRGYWDYEGGGLADMAHHHLDGPAYQFGRDLTAPVEVTPMAPIAHPEACGLWGWCELKYADGFTWSWTAANGATGTTGCPSGIPGEARSAPDAERRGPEEAG
jgi:hypothetical protein